MTRPDIQRCLIVQTNRLGDCILATPALRLIRETYPCVRVDVLHRQRREQEIFERLEEVDNVIRWEPLGIHRGIGGRVRLYQTIKAGAYDAAIFFYSSPAPFWAAWAARVPLRITRHTVNHSDRYIGSVLCNRVIEQDRNLSKRHEAEYNMELLAPLGITPRRIRPHIAVRKGDRAAVEALLRESGARPNSRLAVLHPGASAQRALWPSAGFAAVGDALARLGATVVVIGGPEDGELPDMVRAAMRQRAVNLGGRLSVPALAALMERAAIHVGLDTGPMHVAAAFGAPIVLLMPQLVHREVYGRWRPYGSDFIPLIGTAICPGCRPGRCLPRARDAETACGTSITFETAIEAAAALFMGSSHPGIVRWEEETNVKAPPAYAESASALR